MRGLRRELGAGVCSKQTASYRVYLCLAVWHAGQCRMEGGAAVGGSRRGFNVVWGWRKRVAPDAPRPCRWRRLDVAGQVQGANLAGKGAQWLCPACRAAWEGYSHTSTSSHSCDNAAIRVASCAPTDNNSSLHLCSIARSFKQSFTDTRAPSTTPPPAPRTWKL